MPYATAQDIIDRYGEDLLYAIADRDGDQVLDQPAIERALADAGHEIDAYLAGRYPLPLVSPPPVLKKVAVDIAVYLLSGDRVTEERRHRYTDAVKLLVRIGEGKVRLGLPAAEEPASGDQVLVAAAAPTFTRDALENF